MSDAIEFTCGESAPAENLVRGSRAFAPAIASLEEKRSYDLILIGSGMGALTIASLIAQLRGKRVLVLERHFKAGGFTHDFERQQFHWDVGIHYVGQMQEGSSMRQLFDLVTRKGVQWQQMPEPFEKFVYPNFTFNLYGDPKRFQADLIQQFPQEQPAIRRYFRDLPKAATALFLHILRLNGNWLSHILHQFENISANRSRVPMKGTPTGNL